MSTSRGVVHLYMANVDGERCTPLVFFGDQLTVERARSSLKARIASDTSEDSLDGLQPAAADWHAEANFLQVNSIE